MILKSNKPIRAGFPNLGDVRGLKVVVTWVHLYQWGDAIDVKGDADAKRLGTPELEDASGLVHTGRTLVDMTIFRVTFFRVKSLMLHLQ